MAEAEAHLGRHATDASHRRARLVRAYRLLRRDLVGKDEADVRPRRTPMTMGAAGGSMNPELIFEIATPLGFIVRCTRAYWEFIVTQKHPALTRALPVPRPATTPARGARSLPTRYGAAVWIGPCT